MHFYITILCLTRVFFYIHCSQYVQSSVIDNKESEKSEGSNIISSHNNGKQPKVEDSPKVFAKNGNNSKSNLPAIYDIYYHNVHRQRNTKNKRGQTIYKTLKGGTKPVEIHLNLDNNNKYIIKFNNKGNKKKPNRKVTKRPKYIKDHRFRFTKSSVEDVTDDYITIEKVKEDPEENTNLSDNIDHNNDNKYHNNVNKYHNDDNTNNVKVFENNIYIDNSKYKGDKPRIDVYQPGKDISYYTNIGNIATEATKTQGPPVVVIHVVSNTTKNNSEMIIQPTSQKEVVLSSTDTVQTDDKETDEENYMDKGDVYENRDEEQLIGNDAYINLDAKTNSKNKKNNYKKLSLQIPEHSYQIDDELQKLLAKKSGLKGDQVQAISFQKYIATLMEQQLKKSDAAQSNNEELGSYKRRYKTK